MGLRQVVGVAEELFEFTDEQQKRVHRGLLLIGPGPAAFFRDACRLMSAEHGLETTSHLVTHCLREVENALLDVMCSLARGVEPTRVADRKKGESCGKKAEHTARVNESLAVLGLLNTDPIAEAWRRLPKAINLHGKAHRRGLRAPRPRGPDLEDAWESVVRILDGILDRFQARYVKAVDLVDGLLKIPNPNANDAFFLRDNAPSNPSLLAYFFSKCDNPGWIGPLRAAGFFTEPPSKGAWHFWPQSEYLARVAPLAPDEAAAVIDDLGERLSEPVLENLARAAIGMPATAAGRVGAKIAWLLGQMEKLETGKEVGELIAHLADAGDDSTALQLAGHLFDVVSAPPERQEASRKAGLGPAEPNTRLEEWAFRERFARLLPTLAERAGLSFVSTLADGLDRCITLQYSARGNEPGDLSFVWRPAVEDHGQNYPFGTGSLLVESTRAAAERMVEQDCSRLQSVIEIFERHHWDVFARLALHILRVSEARDLSLLARYLADRRLFDKVGMQHEYALLLGWGFRLLPPEDQVSILSWIEDGPDPLPFRTFVRRGQGREATDDEVASDRKRWQLERLSWIKDGLPAKWQEFRALLIGELGEPRHPTFLSWHASFRGPTSPKTEPELGALSTQELVAFLGSWVPSGDHWSPTPEGLGRVLSSLAVSRAADLSAAASSFIGLDATYVSAFFGGLRDAVKAGASLSWQNVLELASWAVSQPREIPGREPLGYDQDPHWGWCRRRIGDLLSAGLDLGPSELPYEHRPLAWIILDQLMSDPDPGATEEEQKSMGYATIAINSVRGVALAAVCRYCLWVRRQLEKLPDKELRLARGFDEMPEARAVLDHHLDTQKDPSLAIRAVYGQYFPWLHLVDPNWAQHSAVAIFPLGEGELARWQAAWATYVTFCNPYNDLLPILLSQYHLAIDRVGKTNDADKVGHPDLKLGEHLLAFFCRGRIDLDSEDGLLAHLFEAAPPRVRGEVLNHLGWTLYREAPPPTSVDLRVRLVRLWEWRVKAGLTTAEASAFGWWFASRFFDEEWSLFHLEHALSVSANVKLDHFVVGRLAEMAMGHPKECLRCMRVLVLGREPFHLYGWQTEITAVVSAARRSQIGNLRVEAEELVNRLISLGLIDFRTMLEEDSDQD